MDRLLFATSPPSDGGGSVSSGGGSRASAPGRSGDDRRHHRDRRRAAPSSAPSTSPSYDGGRQRRSPRRVAGKKHNPRGRGGGGASPRGSETSSTASSSDGSVGRSGGGGGDRGPSSSLDAFERALESECPSVEPSVSSSESSAASGGSAGPSLASSVKSAVASAVSSRFSSTGPTDSFGTYGTGCATAGTLQTRASRVREHLLRRRQIEDQRRRAAAAAASTGDEEKSAAGGDDYDGEASRCGDAHSGEASWSSEGGSASSKSPSRDWRPRDRAGRGCPGAAEGEEQPVVAFKTKTKTKTAPASVKVRRVTTRPNRPEEAPRPQVIRRGGDASVSTKGSGSRALSSRSVETASTVSSLGSWSAPSQIGRKKVKVKVKGKGEGEGGGTTVASDSSFRTAATTSSWMVGVSPSSAHPAVGCLLPRRRIPIDRRTRLLLVFPVAVLCALSFAVLGASRIDPEGAADGVRYGPAPPPSQLRKEGKEDSQARLDVQGGAHRRLRLQGTGPSRSGSRSGSHSGDDDGTTKISTSAPASTASSSSSVGSFLRGLFPFLSSSSEDGRRRNTRALIDVLPEHLDRYPFTNLAEVTDPPAANDTAFLWQIPRAGGTTLKHILGSCLDRVQASRVSRDYCDVDKNELETCDTKFGKFVNADPSDDPGIRRASDLGLVQSGLADVVVSSRFLHAAALFDPQGTVTPRDTDRVGGRGRAFAAFRHPVERAASTFYYLRDAAWERNYSPEFKSMTLREYAAREETPRNWMVRWLTGKNHQGTVSRNDLEFAKLLLERKFLVLLTDDMSDGVDRLIKHMGWEDDVSKSGKKCARSAGLKDAAQNAGDGESVGEVEEGSEDWEALAKINELDIELYEYARKLYKKQGKMVFGKDEAAVAGKASVSVHVPPDMAKLAAKFEAAAGNADSGSTSAKDKGDETGAAAQHTKGAKKNAKSVKALKNAKVLKDGKVLDFADALKDAAAKKAELPLPPEMAKLAAAFGGTKDDGSDGDGGKGGKRTAAAVKA